MAGDLDMINKWAEIKQFSKQLDQAIVARTRAQSENNNEIGADFSESILSHMIQCGTANDNFSTLRAQWIWFSEQYCRCASPRERDDYFSMKTPMGNTVLHMAAWYGMDDVVDAVAKNAPNLLFSFNSNEDTPLHIAARAGNIRGVDIAGNIRTVEKLLATYANFKEHGIAEEWIKYNNREDLSVEDYSEEINIEDLKELVRKKNKAEGNTMFHEAMLCGKLVNVLLAFEPYKTEGREGGSLSESCYEYTLIANHAKQSVLYLAVEAGDQNVVQLILDKCHHYGEMMGTLSPILAAIMHRNAGMLCIMLDKKPHWIHLMDKNGRLPLHYAASTGYLEGVIVLLDRCKCCSNRRDEYGYVPLHLASNGGHVEVVKELLKHCLDSTEMLTDSYKRNILHIAAKSGKHEVVRYILRTAAENHYEMMINQRDSRGDTPLHLATRSCHPKTVHCLTWDPRVDLGVINENKETALDIANALYQHNNQNASMRLQLVWIALKSAGVKQSSSTVLPIESRPSYSKPDEKTPEMKLINDKVGNKDSDRVETLSIVSTLIITASVAACLGVPGEADGRANNLYHAMFQVFIICITISLFSSISATIILFWARLGLIELLAYSLKIIMPLLGVALISLSLAFLAGIYTVISQLSWLATLFLVMAGIFVVVEFSLYILLFLPSSSTNKLLRYISYYPFLFLASLAESRSNQGTGFNLQGFLERASRN